MMRVCLITPEYPPMQGGVGDYSSHLALALRKLGLEVTVLTSSKASPVPDSVDVFDRVEPSITDWSFSCWKKITAYVSHARPDVLHIQYQTAGYAMHPAINLLPMRLKMMGRFPRIVTTFHDLKVPYLFPKAGVFRRLPGYLLASHSDAVVVTNSEDCLSLTRGAGREGRLRREAACLYPCERGTLKQGPLRPTVSTKRPLFAIPIGSNIPKSPPSGYDREAWRQRIGVRQDELLLAYFGFLNESKGVDTLLQALGEVLHSGLSARLLMIGGSFGASDPTNIAYGQRIQRRVETSEYSSKVIWTGFTSREEVSANLLASDICVLPFNEGASLRHGSLVAAIVHGLPIITTKPSVYCSQCEFLPALDKAVRLVPAKDADALGRAIVELDGSRHLRDELRNAAAALAPAFDWNSIGKAHLQAYTYLKTTE